MTTAFSFVDKHIKCLQSSTGFTVRCLLLNPFSLLDGFLTKKHLSTSSKYISSVVITLAGNLSLFTPTLLLTLNNPTSYVTKLCNIVFSYGFCATTIGSKQDFICGVFHPEISFS